MSFALVTADGRLRRADWEHNPELIWALRGGGNFGVVTALEFQLYEVPEVYAGAMFFPWDRSAEVLRAWLDWTRTVPDEVTSVGRMLQFPPLPVVPQPLRGESFAVLELVFLGDKAAGTSRPNRCARCAWSWTRSGWCRRPASPSCTWTRASLCPTSARARLLGRLDEAVIDAFVAVVGPGSGSALAPYDTGCQYLNFTEASTDPARFYRPDVFHRLRRQGGVRPGRPVSRQPPHPARSPGSRQRSVACIRPPGALLPSLGLTAVTTAEPSGEFLSIVVGYDGSPPASRALDAAVRLLRGRVGRIEVVWVAHLSSTVMMSAGAVAEMEESFDELAPEIRDQAAGQLDGSGLDWGFERLQGLIADELIAMATGLRDARPGQTVVIVVGSSSHATHRVVGSVTVSLARHSPVPVVIVP